MQIAAIVLSAGFSSRMEGAFKPLLPLGNGTILEQVIRTFQAAGIRDIRVVVGYKADAVRPIIGGLHARSVKNPRYEQGMFSSVVAGLETLENSIEGILVHPVDIPLVRPETIRRLLGAFQESPDRILFPVFQGRRGHPALIPRSHICGILAWRGENGLKGAFSQLQEHTLDVAVADEGILKDMDTPEDYRRFETINAEKEEHDERRVQKNVGRPGTGPRCP